MAAAQGEGVQQLVRADLGPRPFDDRAALAALDGEVDVAHGMHAPEASTEPAHANDRLRRARAGASSAGVATPSGGGPPRPAKPRTRRSTDRQSPITPSGETTTIARKIRPMYVSKRSEIPRAYVSSIVNTNAPIHAPSSRYSPPITAITRMSIVRVRSIDPGETRVLCHTDSTPAIAAMSAPAANPSVRWRRTWNPSALIRTGSSRTPWSVSPNADRAT